MSRFGVMALFLWGMTIAPTAGAQNALLDAFLAAPDVESRAKASERLLTTRTEFSVLFARIRTGRDFLGDVETGRLEWERKGAGGRHRAVVLVPDDYDPSKRYRVCVYLHGGVNRSDAPPKDGDWWRRFDRFDGVDQISVFPASWRASLWWQPSQVENLRAVLDRIKTTYNIDENRVFLYGVSDGGTGVYYYAMKAATEWAGFLPFIGHPSVLANPSTGVVGEMFESNLVNRPLYIVNGETDRLYPAARVLPYVEAFREEGARVVFRARPGGHNTRWWNAEQGRLDAFMEASVRDPLPDRLSWRTDDPKRFGRFAWLVIDTLKGAKPAGGVFPHRAPSGSVVVDRKDNHFEVATEGVGRFTLLLSPDEVDFDEPIKVTTNGVVSHDGMVETSRETLLAWAAIDNDRTMLFGAELSIDVN